MKTKTMADVLPIFVVPIPSLLHQNNIGITYVGTSNFCNGTNKICAIIFCGNAPVYN
jgi:hypothetical protein